MKKKEKTKRLNESEGRIGMAAAGKMRKRQVDSSGCFGDRENEQSWRNRTRNQ